MKLNLKTILCGVAAVFGLIAACMLFAPALTQEVMGISVDYTGADIAFGKEIALSSGFAASAYMLPLFLAIIGVACVVVAALGKGGKIVPIVAAVAFIGAAIVYFIPFQVAMPKAPEGVEADTAEFRDGLKEAFDLGAGAIVGGIFSIIAAVAAVVPVFVCKEN